jgi:hypothetical protein
MNLLDENIREDQRMFLRKLRVPFRQIGYEIAPAGTQDDGIILHAGGVKYWDVGPRGQRSLIWLPR